MCFVTMAARSRDRRTTATLYGVPATTLNKIQRVKNNLARAVCRRGGRADARLLLKSLQYIGSRLTSVKLLY